MDEEKPEIPPEVPSPNIGKPERSNHPTTQAVPASTLDERHKAAGEVLVTNPDPEVRSQMVDTRKRLRAQMRREDLSLKQRLGLAVGAVLALFSTTPAGSKVTDRINSQEPSISAGEAIGAQNASARKKEQELGIEYPRQAPPKLWDIPAVLPGEVPPELKVSKNDIKKT